MNIFFLFIAIL